MLFLSPFLPLDVVVNPKAYFVNPKAYFIRLEDPFFVRFEDPERKYASRGKERRFFILLRQPLFS